MARIDHPGPFPFPIPERVFPPRSTPFPPPQLRPEDTSNVPIYQRQIGGIPIPFFFAIGAVLGMLIALSVVYARRAPRPAQGMSVSHVEGAGARLPVSR